MHEWALAESVIETVKRETENRDVKSVDRVIISCGALQNIDEEIFRTGLEEYLTGDVPVKLESFLLETVPAEFSCNRCGNRWVLDPSSGLTEEELEGIHFLPEAAHSFLSCPECGSPDFTVLEGRGISIKSIEITEKGE